MRSLSLILVMLTAFFQQAVAADPEPSTDHSPQEVVQIVIKALKNNRPEDGDSGIATVFRFASPGNRAQTGPLDRFTKMIKYGFADMLNHVGSRTESMVIDGNKAVQPVWLTTEKGQEIGYLFQIGKQVDGLYDGIWMTEAVFPLPGKSQSI